MMLLAVGFFQTPDDLLIAFSTTTRLSGERNIFFTSLLIIIGWSATAPFSYVESSSALCRTRLRSGQLTGVHQMIRWCALLLTDRPMNQSSLGDYVHQSSDVGIPSTTGHPVLAFSLHLFIFVPFICKSSHHSFGYITRTYYNLSNISLEHMLILSFEWSSKSTKLKPMITGTRSL